MTVDVSSITNSDDRDELIELIVEYLVEQLENDVSLSRFNTPKDGETVEPNVENMVNVTVRNRGTEDQDSVQVSLEIRCLNNTYRHTDSTTISLDATTSLNIDNSNTSNGITIGTATSGVPISIGHTTSETTVNDNLTVTGDLTVNGTTTTVNSTTVTIDDPIFTLGGDTAPGSDDNKDRGIEFRYHDGSAARLGFFGYDDSASAFTFLTAASNSSEVFSGTIGNVTAGVGTFASLDISGNIDIDGTSNFPATMQTHASQLYSKNISSFVKHMLKEGELNLDLKDEIISGAMFTHKGEITHQPTKELISNT